LLQAFYAKVREVLQQYRGTEINTRGDGILAAFDGPGRAVRCAGAIRNALRPFDLEIRCGLHTGECERVDNDLAVHCTCPLSGVTQTSRFAPQKAMSALPPTATAKADFRDLKVYSVGGPCPLWPNCGLLDHLVGNQQKVASNHQAERFQRRAIVTPTTRKRKRRRDAKSANQ
jgi:hypothetical protein